MRSATSSSPRRWLPATIIVGGALMAVTGSACSDVNTSDTLVVSAASSLADAFAAVAVAFETQNPDIDVVLNVGGSSTLREQILGGAPVDVFAAADVESVSTVVDATDRQLNVFVFATNTLAIGVPPQNPGAVESLDDLERPDLLVGLCAVSVPCGAYAEAVLNNAGVEPSVDTREPDVRSLVLKLSVGELDAGIVYASDAAGPGTGIDAIEIPEAVNVVAEYPIVALSDVGSSTRFVEFVLSDPGQRILASYGFSAP